MENKNNSFIEVRCCDLAGLGGAAGIPGPPRRRQQPSHGLSWVGGRGERVEGALQLMPFFHILDTHSTERLARTHALA